MTASSELRAAATKLRGAATGATSGPWATHPVPGDRGTDVIDPASVSDLGPGYEPLVGVYVTHDAGEEDAAWIALASPVIAEPLARALDLLADRWDTHDPVLDAMHQHDETAVGHHLLVIARQINGGGS